MATNEPPLVPQVIKCIFGQTYGGATNIMNRLFFEFSGTMDETASLTVAQRLSAQWLQLLAPLLPSHFSLGTITVLDMGSAAGNQVTITAGHVGVKDPTDFLPAKDCLVFTGQVPRRYRGGKPRWYQSGIPASDLLDNQHFTPAALTAWSGGFNTLIADMANFNAGNATIMTCCNVSLIENYTWAEIPLSNGGVKWVKHPTYRTTALKDPMQDYVANPVIASQRRRGVN